MSVTIFSVTFQYLVIYFIKRAAPSVGKAWGNHHSATAISRPHFSVLVYLLVLQISRDHTTMPQPMESCGVATRFVAQLYNVFVWNAAIGRIFVS
jgi:hypothetical protein